MLHETREESLAKAVQSSSAAIVAPLVVNDYDQPSDYETAKYGPLID